MIRHIVVLELVSEEAELRATQTQELIERLEALSDLPGVISIRVHEDLGLVPGHWPLVLVSAFEDNDELVAYQAHPRHREVLAWMNSGVIGARATVDYVDE